MNLISMRNSATGKAETPVCLVMGPGGSGKSQLIRDWAWELGPQALVVAPTALAAKNLEDRIRIPSMEVLVHRPTTIHAAFGFKPGLWSTSVVPYLLPEQSQVLREISVLIIDEISMVRADLLDRIDQTLRKLRQSSELFGGVKVVLVGDPFQLPPVVPKQEEPYLLSTYGENGQRSYFFTSMVLQEARSRGALSVQFLEGQHRQSDPIFIQALNSLRVGLVSKRVLDLVNQRFGCLPSDSESCLHLTQDRESAQWLNGHYLKQVGLGSLQTFDPVLWVREPRYHDLGAEHPMNLPVQLTVGGAVMFCQNHPQGIWRNGSQGTVVDIDGQVAWVSMGTSQPPVAVKPTAFEITVPVRRPGGEIESEVVARIKQLPLLGGYAMTIHRSQALTLEGISLALGCGGIFPGQAYTALSRVRSLERVYLKTPIREMHFVVAPEVLQFVEEMRSLAQIRNPLDPKTRVVLTESFYTQRN